MRRAEGSVPGFYVLAMAASACDGEGGGEDSSTQDLHPSVEVRYRTKYLDVAPFSDAPVCAGTLAMMDDHVDYMLELLNLEIEERILVYLMHPGDARPEIWCDDLGLTDTAIGCYGGGIVHADMEALPHELIHAVTAVRGLSWWVEGVAYGLSGGQNRPDWMFSDQSLEVWSDARGRSGHLARWLIERFGGEVYMDLYDRTPWGADRSGVEAAVRDVLGQGFDEVLSEYAATADYGYPDHWACYVPKGVVASPVGDYWAHEVMLDCDALGTFNNEDNEVHRMTARIPVAIDNPGRYRFIADDPEAEVSLQPCLTAPTQAYDPDIYAWPIAQDILIGAKMLEPGHYVLIVNVPPGPPRTVRLAGYLSIDDTYVP